MQSSTRSTIFVSLQDQSPEKMKEIRTEIIIDAPRSEVWQVLTDFGKYARWNPFIVESEGQAIKGSKLRNVMKPGEKTQTFRPVVTQVEEGKRFEWLGKLPLNAFIGRHYFELEDVSGGKTKLIHGEHFGGWFRGFIMKKVGEETRRGFIAMNRALKLEVEQGGR